ncbi:cell division protein FtsZ [Neoehrlichia mikurensis]|uniref:Cell division protein FtsZ n=2 Tax=Neoehrlichia mikurensis TaxID=89586 RepID=A0A9Q9F3Y3_9RICK|nr:cell division protein FtsZ [Neoehrlichia mikurensis]QXK91590.1 cell division protein FtsZ [Neoehrlichia mikurensis]QXK92801.1 cell division protein FtsZ [Neoehrlichia mikurensis]QXK93280.1 cell division protein FtsZ [Neoehrlichia mikurensis]UTO55790.1 cell division protein FtsZ [Neoehrlichia mikurensis]UTO56705.1 cell division protein FtsZ [Neoehrlichia mikurensis]
MSLNVYLPDQSLLRPKITVLGVGGAGGNAVNNMIQSNLNGVNFIAANTDAQALEYSLSEKKIQLGINLTKGLGAGSLPEIGKGAAEESISEIMEEISDSNMLFITAGMGGGTGTGAAPVIAKIAKENKILTVGVVTKPFHFEGAHRMKIADFGLEELQKYVDTLIIIPNQNLFRIANENTTFADAFKLADTVLHTGVRGITDLMVMPGLINLDFADIRVVMSEMGKAMMGTGEADGENRAIAAAEAAISNPLLDNISMKGAKGILINITGGLDMTLFEVDAAANRIREEVDNNANIIFGSTFNENSEGKIRVSVLATGIDNEEEFLQNQKQTDQQSTSNMSFINNYLSNTHDDLTPNHNIAYYNPANPEDTELINSIISEKKEEKSQKNIFNRMSEAILNQKPHSLKTNNQDNSWNEEKFNIPAFLRKK